MHCRVKMINAVIASLWIGNFGMGKIVQKDSRNHPHIITVIQLMISLLITFFCIYSSYLKVMFYNLPIIFKTNAPGIPIRISNLEAGTTSNNFDFVYQAKQIVCDRYLYLSIDRDVPFSLV